MAKITKIEILYESWNPDGSFHALDRFTVTKNKAVQASRSHSDRSQAFEQQWQYQSSSPTFYLLFQQIANLAQSLPAYSDEKTYDSILRPVLVVTYTDNTQDYKSLISQDEVGSDLCILMRSLIPLTEEVPAALDDEETYTSSNS